MSLRLRTELPDMVYDRANYDLIFNQDFTGELPDPDSSGCIDSLSALDLAVWNAFNTCTRVDAAGTPCTRVSDSHLHIGHSHECRSTIRTRGRFHYKYGYLEVKYTVDLNVISSYTNYYMVAGVDVLSGSLRELWRIYGVEVGDWEAYLKNALVENDIIEYVQTQRRDVLHQYANWHFDVRDADLVPIRSTKNMYFCTLRTNSIVPRRLDSCAESGSKLATVTLGIEWTPSGYITNVKVDGVHDELTPVPEDKIEIEHKPVVLNGEGRLVTQSQRQIFSTSRNAYFGHVDSAKTGTSLLLEQIAVSHVPLPLGLGTNANLRTNRRNIVSSMSVDYIRVWQPRNHYSDMEPVYK